MLDKSKENAYNKDNKTKERNKKQGGQSNEDIALLKNKKQSFNFSD